MLYLVTLTGPVRLSLSLHGCASVDADHSASTVYGMKDARKLPKDTARGWWRALSRQRRTQAVAGRQLPHRAQRAEMPGCAPQGRRDARGGVEGRAARRRRGAAITTSSRLTARAHAEAQLDAAARPPPPSVQVSAPRRRVPPSGSEEGLQESVTASPSSRTGSPGPAGPGGKRERLDRRLTVLIFAREIVAG
jgi:hypothetical protein